MNPEKFKFKLNYKIPVNHLESAIDYERIAHEHLRHRFIDALENFSIYSEEDSFGNEILWMELYIMSNNDMLEFLDFYDTLTEIQKNSYKQFLTSKRDINKRLDIQFNDEMRFRI